MRIKKESFPTRCEICHQADCYNPETDHCTRCQGVPALISQARQRAVAPSAAPRFAALSQSADSHPILTILAHLHNTLSSLHPQLPLHIGMFAVSLLLTLVALHALFPSLGGALAVWGIGIIFCVGGMALKRYRSEPTAASFPISIILAFLPTLVAGLIGGVVMYRFVLAPSWDDIFANPGAVRSLLRIGKRPTPSALLNAAKGGHLETVKLLLASGAQVNVMNQDGRTPLMLACDLERDEVAQALLNAGADVNARDHDGWTALLLATRSKSAGMKFHETARLLLVRGALPNVVDLKNRTPLIYAAEKGDVETVRELLKRGADPQARDQEGLTPLILAEHVPNATNRPGETAKILLDYLADPNTPDNTEHTPLMHAIQSLKNPQDIQPIQDLLEKGALVNTTTQKGETALGFIGETGSVAVAQLLFQHGAEIRLNGDFALATAAKSGHTELAIFLIDHGANPNTYVGAYGYPPVVLALRAKNEETFRALLNHGANGNLVNQNGMDSLLTEAICFGTLEIVKTLLEHPVIVDYPNSLGQTPLMFAVRNNEEAMTRCLLEKGANPNLADKEGHSVLRYAVPYSNPKILKLLLEKGAHKNSDPEVVMMLQKLEEQTGQ